MGVLDPEVDAVVSIMGNPYVVDGLTGNRRMGDVAWLYQDKPLPFVTIPVEQINGPVLLMHGELDELWPSRNSYMLADRLAAYDKQYELQIFPERPHNLGRPADMVHVIRFSDDVLR